MIGGLLGAYSVSENEVDRKILLTKAIEIADLMIDSHLWSEKDGGFPLPEINLKLKTARNHPYNGYFTLSEVGTWQLEWRYLSYLTKEPKYQQLADRAHSNGTCNCLLGLLASGHHVF